MQKLYIIHFTKMCQIVQLLSVLTSVWTPVKKENQEVSVIFY